MDIADLLPVPFVKMNGAGNDFIIIDHREPFLPAEVMRDFVRRVCRRRFSVGADGLFLIEKSHKTDFKWQFFNSDGSVAEMCGNGARCVARYAYMHGIAAATMRFETDAGIIEAKVVDRDVSLKMPPPHSYQPAVSITIGDTPLEVHSLNTGVPHAVVFHESVDKVDIAKLGPPIRFHDRFQPAGTNVNFVEVTERGLKIRTYERGVEAETMACGTGAVACGVIATLLDKTASPVQIETTGKDLLTVRFDLAEDHSINNVVLKGSAHVIYKGELTSGALHL